MKCTDGDIVIKFKSKVDTIETFYSIKIPADATIDKVIQACFDGIVSLGYARENVEEYISI